MAKRGRKKTQQTILNPRGETATARKKRIARERKRYGTPCFIATAVYGSSNAPEINALREFRDSHLRPYKMGRVLIGYYYRLSPPIAYWLRSRPVLSRMIRAVLNLIVKIIKAASR